MCVPFFAHFHFWFLFLWAFLIHRVTVSLDCRWNVWCASTNDGPLWHGHATYSSLSNGIPLLQSLWLLFLRALCFIIIAWTWVLIDMYIFPGPKARIFSRWQVPEKRFISLSLVTKFLIESVLFSHLSGKY